MAGVDPLSTLGRRQDGIRQGHLAVRQPRSCPVIRLVGKENIVIHAAKEEGREGDDKHKLSQLEDILQQDTGKAIPLVVAVDLGEEAVQVLDVVPGASEPFRHMKQGLLLLPMDG